MITFPCAKINLGLNIVSKREDGYHNLETVFYPIPLTDALEIQLMDEGFPSVHHCDLKITGNDIECNEQENLVVKAYNLLAADYQLPRIHTHLYKKIPSQAGMGGGSSDAASMLKLLTDCFSLNISVADLQRYAVQLGADCPFFITAQPAFATGIGEVLSPIDLTASGLHNHYIAVVKPSVAVSTKEAFSLVKPQQPAQSCKDIVMQPIATWRDRLTNDFETSAFAQYPQLNDIKQELYRLGAVYAQMSGSGSSLFGIFKEEPRQIQLTFKDAFTFVAKL